MGCLSSAQASPTVVTIENRQRSNASSLPPKHEQSRVHEDRSLIEPEASKKQFKGKAQIETKPDVFVLKSEDTDSYGGRSRSEESIELYNEQGKTDNHVVYNVTDDDGRRSRSEESIELYNGPETNENVIYNVEEATNIAKTSQSEQELPKEEHKMDKANNKERATPQNSDVIQRQEVNDIPEYPTVFRNSRHGNKSEDADSGFENPEIASVSAYSPDDNSDDDMF